MSASLAAPQAWGRVRHWLRDLSVELEAGVKDRSIPDLAPDRVWITSDGRAKLLDWRAPGIDGEAPKHVDGAYEFVQSAQRFLSAMAVSALAGSPAAGEPRHDPLARSLPLPLCARRFLQQLAQGAFQNLEQVNQVLDSLVVAPPAVSRRSRWVHVAVCGALPALIWIYFVPSFFLLARWGAVHPQRWELATCVVTASGAEVSRGRALVRALIAWCPVVVAYLAVFAAMEVMEPSGEVQSAPWLPLFWVVFVVLPAAVVASIVWSVYDPQRGLQDRLAETYLVPR